MYDPIGSGGGYNARDDGGNSLLKPSGGGQFGGFDNIDMNGQNWFRGAKWRDRLGRGTVKQNILGPLASDNALLQYNFPKQQSDTNPFTFF